MQNTRIILCHSQASSARLRFMRFSYVSIFAFQPLPKLATMMDDDSVSKVAVHPAAIIQQVAEKLNLSKDDIEAVAEYQVCVDVAGGPVNILLVRFTSIDPPFELAEKLDAEFIDLTQARGLPQVELECLRKAYEVFLGG